MLALHEIKVKDNYSRQNILFDIQLVILLKVPIHLALHTASVNPILGKRLPMLELA